MYSPSVFPQFSISLSCTLFFGCTPNAQNLPKFPCWNQTADMSVPDHGILMTQISALTKEAPERLLHHSVREWESPSQDRVLPGH